MKVAKALRSWAQKIVRCWAWACSRFRVLKMPDRTALGTVAPLPNSSIQAEAFAAASLLSRLTEFVDEFDTLHSMGLHLPSCSLTMRSALRSPNGASPQNSPGAGASSRPGETVLGSTSTIPASRRQALTDSSCSLDCIRRAVSTRRVAMRAAVAIAAAVSSWSLALRLWPIQGNRLGSRPWVIVPITRTDAPVSSSSTPAASEVSASSARSSADIGGPTT